MDKSEIHSNPVEKIFSSASECAFDKEQKAVCSPKSVIKSMHDFIKEKDSNVSTSITTSDVVNNPIKIVSNMKELLDCNSESCILKKPEFVQFAKISKIDNILNEFFKPSGPATHFGLLNNFNIDEVLDQFESKFPGFYHIPFQMRDFEKVGTELANIDLVAKFKGSGGNPGIKSFGVVLNTDYSTGRGIHWYCIFGEKVGNKIILEYFNSSGREPLSETQAWLQKTKHYLAKELKCPVEIHYSTGIQFQNDEHSCGVYCLMYIWLRLEGTSAKWFRSDNFNDAVMHKARKVLFRHEV
jgi:hypothetical protein